jgi:hypothetical protein
MFSTASTIEANPFSTPILLILELFVAPTYLSLYPHTKLDIARQ